MSYRTDSKVLVLAVLAEEPLHGYGIIRRIREQSGEVLKFAEGQLYPLLHSLEESGFIVGQWEMQEGDPPRKVYAITDEGRNELRARSEKWLSFAGAVAKVISKTRLEPNP